MLFLGFIIYFFRYDFVGEAINPAKLRIYFSLSVIFILVGFSTGLYAYLRGDFFTGSIQAPGHTDEYLGVPVDLQELETIKEDVAVLRKKLSSAQIHASQLSPEQQQALVDIVKLQLQGTVAEDITKKIEQKYSAQIIENAQAQPIRNAFSSARERLYIEIKSLTRRNNVNLTIGAATTAIAVSLLAYLVLGSTEQKFSNLPDLLAHFIPRVSVAAFIEVFSFFFLRLYRAGIQEIKYFQNELTNIDMRVVALESTFLKTPNALTEKIVPALAITDRNIAPTGLAKAATTDGQQIDAKSLIELLDKFGKIIGSGKS